MARFGVNCNYTCHTDLISEYADGSTDEVENIGSVDFNSGNVEILSEDYRSRTDLDDAIDFGNVSELEDEIIDAVETKVDTEYEINNVNWV